MFKLKSHRYFQILGLYGVLFLIPVLQWVLSEVSGLEVEYKRKQMETVVYHIYSDVKMLNCELIGQKATTHDCKKGVYQDEVLKNEIKGEIRASEKKSDVFIVYCFFYYLFAISAFTGNYIEYRKEYEQSMTVSTS